MIKCEILTPSVQNRFIVSNRAVSIGKVCQCSLINHYQIYSDIASSNLKSRDVCHDQVFT